MTGSERDEIAALASRAREFTFLEGIWLFLASPAGGIVGFLAILIAIYLGASK